MRSTIESVSGTIDTCGFVGGMLVSTGTSVLHVHIRRTEAALARAKLGQVAFV